MAWLFMVAVPVATAQSIANVHVQPGGDVRVVAGASLNIGEDGTLNNGGPAVGAPPSPSPSPPGGSQ